MEDNEALLRCIARLETEILTKLQDLMEMCQQMLQTKKHARMVTEAPAMVAKFKKTTRQENPLITKKKLVFCVYKKAIGKIVAKTRG